MRPAKWGEHAKPPIADLVAEALHHDRAVAGHHSRGVLLLAQVLHQVARRAGVEVVLALQHLRALPDSPARERPDRLPQLFGATHALALPERHRPRRARRGRDDHAVAADLLDPPGGGPEQEDLPRARLVHHLLVELPHAPPIGQRH